MSERMTQKEADEEMYERFEKGPSSRIQVKIDRLRRQGHLKILVNKLREEMKLAPQEIEIQKTALALCEGVEEYLSDSNT